MKLSATYLPLNYGRLKLTNRTNMFTSFFLFLMMKIFAILLGMMISFSVSFADSKLDVQSLLAFKRGVSLDPFHVLQNWHHNSPNPCNWTGVLCSSKHLHRVIALQLGNNHLGGFIAPEIGNLTFLQYLHLSKNDFTGGIPSSIRGLRRLKEFDTEGNTGLGGVIPSELGGLYKLREFSAAENGLTGAIPFSLGNCSQLRHLSLDKNKLSGQIPNMFGSLTYLSFLNLNENNLSGHIPTSLGSLTNLNYLFLGNNSLAGSIPVSLFNNSMLQQLNLANNALSGTIPLSIGNCSQLQALSFDRNDLSGTIPNTFESLTRLLYVGFSHNSLTGNIPISLFNCSKMKKLDLAYNGLSGSIPYQLGSLHDLTDLNLNFNSLNGTIPSSIANNTALIVLSMEVNHLSGVLPPSIGNLLNLEGILVYNNSLIGRIPTSLCNLTNLFLIDLSENNFHGNVPLCIGRLPMLERFIIGSNKLVSGHNNLHEPPPFLESFYNSSTLTDLEITSNNFQGTLPLLLPRNLEIFLAGDNLFTGNIPKSFANLTRLSLLSLRGNSLQGTIPGEMGLMKSLQGLEIGYNNLEGNIPKEFTLLNQSLFALYISHNKLSGPIPDFVGNLNSLGILNLSINFFSGSIPKQLGKCVNLELLDLSSNQLSGEIPVEISNVRNIHVAFDLSRNLLSGTAPRVSLQMAEVIDLSHNNLSGEIGQQLPEWLDARIIDISFNNFSGVLPDSLGANLPALQSLDLSSNNFTGVLPESLYNPSKLSFMNVSYNNFEGNVTCSGSFRKLSNKSFLHNPMLCGRCFNLTQCKSKSGHKHSSAISKNMVIIIVVVIIVSVLGSILLLFLLFAKKPNQNEIARSTVGNQFMVVSEEEVRRATSNFSPNNLLGEGSHGRVYAGVLSQGDPVAIKIFKDDQRIPEKRSLLRECQTLGRVRHRNLIKITTVCCTDNLKAMIMPLMPKGNLHSLLHEKDTDGNLVPLSLQRRIRILKEIAAGLSYLHHHCKPPIVHCDVKPENLLLDYEFTVKLSDFGIAQLLGVSDITITSILRGSIGYIAPEFGVGEVTVKGDIYSFGVVLLEVMTRMKPTDPMFTDDMSLCRWVVARLEADEERMQLKSILSSNWGLETIEDDEWELVEKILKVGIACCSLVAKDRPKMHEVEGFFATLCEDANYGDRIGPGQTDAILASSIKPIKQATEYDTSSTFE